MASILKSISTSLSSVVARNGGTVSAAAAVAGAGATTITATTTSGTCSTGINSNSISNSKFNLAGYNLSGSSIQYKKLLVVIKQTAFEEYSQLKMRGQAPKALRWKRLESRYRAHKQCVTELIEILQNFAPNIQFSCVNRVELDRQHLSNVDLVIAVGGDGTVLSSAHFLDHGTIPLLGINSDPNVSVDDSIVLKKQSDERRSHGALCMCTAVDMESSLIQALHGEGTVVPLTRIRCKVKSTFSETRLVPVLNDILIANPSPAAVSRFRMGWLHEARDESNNNIEQHFDNNNNNNNNEQGISQQQEMMSQSAAAATATKNMYGSITRFDGVPYNVSDSINVWSSGMWVSTATGSTAAMKAAGGHVMDCNDSSLQYLIREHMIEHRHWLSLQEDAKQRGVSSLTEDDINNGFIKTGDKLHIRWNSQHGRIFVDGSHLIHQLELGDEILIDNQAPPLKMFRRTIT